MIRSATARVKAAVRPEHQQPPQKYQQTRQITFAFRADPTALDGVKLSRTARDAFGLVLDNARSRGGRCRLTNAVMARVLGCSAPTVKRALAALEAAGLIRRETVAGGRVRLCIHVTWEGVDHSRSTVQTTVDHPRPRGGSSPIQGVDHFRSTNQSPIQIGDQTGPILPIEGEDVEQAALYAALGPAGYLRAMIAKGEAEAAAVSAVKSPPSPAPAGPAGAPQDASTPLAPFKAAPVADRPAAAKPAASPTTPEARASEIGRTAAAQTYPPAPCVAADQVAAAVARMTRGLADQLRAEDVGRRRVGPKKLAAQLAEVRRRHGRAPR